MLNMVFGGVFDAGTASVIAVSQFMICIACAVILGLMMAFVYQYRARATKSFLITLALLPAVVCVVIMMVNGNVGAGVAVAGTFSLVRFRSVPGTAREIGMLFLAMGTGLICGMGYLGYAVLFAVIMTLLYMALETVDFGSAKTLRFKTLRITIPEELDYTGVFDDIFARDLKKWNLSQVKSTNMGSMFRLTYDVEYKDGINEKQMIDDIRVRNGNLEITVSNQDTAAAEL
ncbi:MAG: DUF4956 domain-containing protein [Lachnospiraceae bacterium]|nr:DUF4956 domain-containing protein [Lachnospiraceae bacterium]